MFLNVMNVTKKDLVKLKLKYGYDSLISLSSIEGVEFPQSGGFHYNVGNLQFIYHDFSTCIGVRCGKEFFSIRDFMKIVEDDLKIGLSYKVGILDRQVVVSNFHKLVLIFKDNTLKVGYTFSDTIKKVSLEDNSISLRTSRGKTYLVDIDTYILYEFFI